MKYPLIQRLLHWLVALMVIGAMTIGLIFMIYDGFNGTKEAFGGELTGAFYKYHKTLGVLILGAMVLRIVLKLLLEKPDYSVPLSDFERVASAIVHGILYLSLIAMPALGWLATDAGNFPVQVFEWTIPGFIDKDMELYATLMQLHGLCAWLIILCLIAHIGGALKHWLINRDGVMGRMSLF